MNPKITTVLATALVAGAPTLLKADDNADRFYVHADAGATFIQNVGFRVSIPSLSGAFSQHFSPGARGDVAVGYKLTDSLAVEIETGALWNRSGSSVDLYQIPLLENLVYRAHLGNGWTPYIGAGAGAVFGIFSAPVVQHGGTSATDTSDDDVTFGFQGKAGISYAISPCADVDLGYAFLGSFEHHWNIDGVHFDSDKIYTHAVLLSFCWKF